MIARIVTWACALFVVGCSPARGEYRDGARLPPPEARTTYTPAGTGLPGYFGIPEAQRPPRSPHKRVLPPEKGPGIWAAHPEGPPDRKPGSPVPDIELLGFHVPLHPHVMDGFDASPSEHCAHIVSIGLLQGDMRLMERALKLTEPQRACLAALALHRCLQRLRTEYDALPSGKHSHAADGALAFSLHGSIEWMRAACPGAAETKEIPRILEALDRGAPTGRPQWMQ